MGTRKRFSRKDLKQPDEFLTTNERLLVFFKANRGVALSIAVGILVIGSMTGFFLKNRQVQAMRMESVLHEMTQVRVRGEGTQVLAKYLHNFSEGNQKKRAKMILADAYFREKKFDDAIELYQEVLQASQGGKLLHDLSRLSLGYSYERNNDFQKAIETYKTLIKRNRTLPLFNVYYSLARVYEQEEDYKNAVLILRQMQNQFKDHVHFDQVLEKIQKLEELT